MICFENGTRKYSSNMHYSWIIQRMGSSKKWCCYTISRSMTWKGISSSRMASFWFQLISNGLPSLISKTLQIYFKKSTCNSVDFWWMRWYYMTFEGPSVHWLFTSITAQDAKSNSTLGLPSAQPPTNPPSALSCMEKIRIRMKREWLFTPFGTGQEHSQLWGRGLKNKIPNSGE